MNRREAIMACAAAAGMAVLPAGLARAAQPSLLPPLTPLSSDLIERLHKGIAKWEPQAEDLSIPIEQRLVYQHTCGRRYISLAWPHADALHRIEELGKRWPLLRANLDLVAQARIEERESWMEDGAWHYGNVRIDGGPPPGPY